MNKYVKIWAILAILLVVAAIADFLAMHYMATSSPSIFDRRIPFDAIGDMEIFYKIKTMLSSINATLLILLFATYLDMYRKIPSEFTFGLLVFSLTLLFYALSSNPLLQWLFGFRAVGLGPFAMLPDMFTTLALVVLLYLTMK